MRGGLTSYNCTGCTEAPGVYRVSRFLHGDQSRRAAEVLCAHTTWSQEGSQHPPAERTGLCLYFTELENLEFGCVCFVRLISFVYPTLEVLIYQILLHRSKTETALSDISLCSS